ncbi:MAG: glycosyltransferase, partial [Nitrosomonadaceae bacterium]
MDDSGMEGPYTENIEPQVSLLIPTYNRRQYLPIALASAVDQNYSNLEIIVIRDGGEDISDIVSSFEDDRIILIDREENRGIPFTLNEGLRRAGGKYICYLGDDDILYPNHVSTLVQALESHRDYGVAYSDLYCACCSIEHDGSRQVLSKVVDISRDFDRFVMLYFNHTLHVSLMHRRDLIEKTGFYNEDLNILIDWDLTRRMAFFTDFYHVHEITGEFYVPVGDCDSVSIQKRKDKGEYLKNAMTIRTTRPAKPWPMVMDVSIILSTDCLNEDVGKALGNIWANTFYPYEVYLPLLDSEIPRLNTEMPGVVSVTVDRQSSLSERIDAVLSQCDGDIVAIVPTGFAIKEFWLEDSVYALINSAAEREGFELEGSTAEQWAVVVKKKDLISARESFADLPLRESLQAAGIKIRKVRPEEIPFQFDQLLSQANSASECGDFSKAGEM